MTSPVGSNHGFVYLEWNFEGLMEYDGVTGEEFDTKSVEFGFGCDNAWQKDVTFPADDEEGAYANGGDGGEVYGPAGVPYDLYSQKNTGPSDGAKVALFTVAGLSLFCALACCLLYRHALLRQRPPSNAAKGASPDGDDELSDTTDQETF
jgi:hypothetical protein